MGYDDDANDGDAGVDDFPSEPGFIFPCTARREDAAPDLARDQEATRAGDGLCGDVHQDPHGAFEA